MPENPDDMRSYADNSAQSVTQKAGNGLKKGLKAAGRGLKNQGKKYLHRASGKAASNLAGNGLKLVLKKYLWLGTAVLAGILFLVIALTALGDVLFEERGTTESYTLENDEMNVSGINQDDGVRRVIALTEPQALKTAYYRLMSCSSYIKLVNGQTLLFYDPMETDKSEMEKLRQDFASLQDYFKNENYFLLSSDFILMADEILHNYLVYYPEQVIKPIFYEQQTDDDGRPVVKTQSLEDEEKNQLKDNVVYKSYDKLTEGTFSNQPNASDETGVWDYGFGSVLTYQPEEKDIWHKGTILWREHCEHTYDAFGNITSHTVVREEVEEPFEYHDIPLKGQDDIKIGQRQFNNRTLNHLYGNQTTVYPIKIPLISSAALFSGSISYHYEVKETHETFQEGTTTHRTDAVATYAYATCGPNTLREYRQGEAITKCPEKVSEDKDVLGFDYIDQYTKYYTNYVPIGLKNDLDFKKRTEETYDLLLDLGLLKPYTGEVGEVVQGPVNLTALDGVDGTMNDAGTDYRSWNDLTMMAHIIEAEAGNSKLDELMVGAVLYNRWKSGLWGSTLFDCISAPGQYACYNTTDGGTWYSKTPTARAVESAKQVISGEFAIPSNIIFQATFTQGNVFMTVAPHYYCYKSRESLSRTDPWGRVALTAEQLKARASELDGAGSAADSGSSSIGSSMSAAEQIGGAKTVEVTYYCAECNSPRGSDAIAWSGGPTQGHAQAGVTCAMSRACMNMLGVKFGDWIYIEGVGTRRVEDICGTGYGGVSGIKNDRIVVDVYLDANGTCQCSKQNALTHTTAYKTSGQQSTAQMGYYSNSSGLYYCDINNPYGLELFSAENFDTVSATSAFEKLADPERKWYEKLDNALKALLNDALDLFKGLADGLFQEDVFESDRFYATPKSDTDKTHDIIYQALAMTQNKLYSEVISNFDESNMDLIFVGNFNPRSLSSAGFSIINGVGTTVEGFVSPTGAYYQTLSPFSTTNHTVVLVTPAGTPVHAVYTGTVESVAEDSGTVVINHTAKDGTVYRITYGNIAPSLTSRTSVSKEQPVGTTKDGGLQITVQKNGVYVDPMGIFYQPTYGIDGTGLVQCALNEFNAHKDENAPGWKYQSYWNELTHNGWTKSTAWCAIFVGYCAKQVGLVDADLHPWNASCAGIHDWYDKRGWYIPASSGYSPKPGDIILFDWPEKAGSYNHVGIVEFYDGSVVHTIEGNTSYNGSYSPYGKLARKERKSGIIGYCIPGGLD